MMDMQTAVLVSNLQNIAAWGAIILIGISAFVTAIGFTLLGSKFLESAARQPEIMTQLQVRMFLIAGLLDAIPIISVGVAFLLIFANPLLAQLLKYLPH